MLEHHEAKLGVMKNMARRINQSYSLYNLERMTGKWDKKNSRSEWMFFFRYQAICLIPLICCYAILYTGC